MPGMMLNTYLNAKIVLCILSLQFGTGNTNIYCDPVNVIQIGNLQVLHHIVAPSMETNCKQILKPGPEIIYW